MAGDARQSGKTVPDDLSGLVELVRLLARQAAREAIASADNGPPSVDRDPSHHRKETLQ